MDKITNKRYKLFIESLGYSEQDWFNERSKINFNLKYIHFTNEKEEKYLKEKQLNRIFDFKDFDNYCIEFLKKEV